MTTTYCTHSQVSNFLGISAFTTSTNPLLATVEDWINQHEDFIDGETMHAWRSTRIVEETHNIQINSLYHHEKQIFLNNRKITQISGSGQTPDKIEVWNGSTWEDYVQTRTEGRGNDYWLDYQMGILFLKVYPTTYPEFSVRVTYRFGETLNKEITRACILLTAADVLNTDDRSVLLPEGTSNISPSEKANKFREQAMKIISDNKEIKTLGM